MGCFPYFLCLGGLELLSEQAAFYARHGWAPDTACVRDCSTCPRLAQALGHDQFSTPANDAAPWFDPSEPDSYDFGGLLLLQIDGLGPGTYARTVTQLAGEGAVLGAGRITPATVTVTGMLMGRTGCAVAYGLRWLRQALRGTCGPGGTGCGGDDLRYLACCPPELDEDCNPTREDYVDQFAPYWRTLRGVGLIGDVQVIAQYGKTCSCGCGSTPLLQVQFILGASQPCAYRDEQLVHDQIPLSAGALSQNCFEWVKTADGHACADPDGCVPAAGCAADPTCPTPPAPPAQPVAINACVTCTPFTQRSMCLDVEPDLIPAAAEGVIGLDVYAGTKALRHIRIRFFQNPLGLPADQLDPCGACGELNIGYIPAYSTFRLDPGTGATTLECPGRAPATAAGILGGPPGKLFSRPILECGGVRYSVCVEVDAMTVTDSSTLSVSVAAREC